MVVFEVSVNGEKAFAMATGDFGMLTARLMWTRIQTQAGPIHEELRLMGNGLESGGGKHLNWPYKNLKVGDEVTIRIVDAAAFDEPAERVTLEEMQSRITELESRAKKSNSN